MRGLIAALAPDREGATNLDAVLKPERLRYGPRSSIRYRPRTAWAELEGLAAPTRVRLLGERRVDRVRVWGRESYAGSTARTAFVAVERVLVHVPDEESPRWIHEDRVVRRGTREVEMRKVVEQVRIESGRCDGITVVAVAEPGGREPAIRLEQTDGVQLLAFQVIRDPAALERLSRARAQSAAWLKSVGYASGETSGRRGR